MGQVTRRGLLLGGGALGAVGALGSATPARAWTWSPTGSVVGTGAGADPRWVWDDPSDIVVTRLFEDDQVDRVNQLLSGWTDNAQPLPAGLPPYLADFISEARRLPTWIDRGRLDRAFDFYQRRGLYLGALYGFGSGMMSCVIPREARAVYYSAGGAAMKDRIAKTATLGYDIGVEDAFGDRGQMVVTCVKTRLTHSAVRHLLPRSAHWDAVAPEQKPISQADTMVTWHSLATYTHGRLHDWGVPVDAADATAFLHLWQVTAHLLGVRDEYIPADWPQAQEQSRQVLDPVLAPTSEGIELARILLDMASELDRGLSRPVLHAATRYNLGDRIADWLQIPHEPVWDPAMQNGWPPFIAAREGLVATPIPERTYWTFDEFLRLAVLFWLGDGKRINITMPTGNNPHYS